ncbi:transposase, IS605 OrfB family protein [Kalymmatonema gypsitolerans NIES-4073]|nr:transposase, IS605 OrfB family protein [Scytonema sp. NIES-4073]
MLVLEYKVKAKRQQYKAIDESIRTTQFIRNKAIRHWMDAPKEAKVDKIALNNYSTALRKEFAFVKELNSMARHGCNRTGLGVYSQILRQL